MGLYWAIYDKEKEICHEAQELIERCSYAQYLVSPDDQPLTAQRLMRDLYEALGASPDSTIVDWWRYESSISELTTIELGKMQDEFWHVIERARKAIQSNIPEDHRLAINDLESSIRQNRHINSIRNKLLLANALLTLGDLKSSFQFSTAYEKYEHALKLHREINDRLGEALDLYGMGDALRMQGRLLDAKIMLSNAIDINKSLNMKQGVAKCLNNLARYMG